MSGHSKWSQIKHKKGVADAKKGVLFGKIARAISIAARGNPDPTTNLRLKGEVERAHAVNMPSDNIERAIRRVWEKSEAALTELQLEIIGPSGVGIIVTSITDNSNRTINEVRQVASKLGVHMAGQGSVAWMFKREVSPEGIKYAPTTLIPLTSPDQQQALEHLLGALDELDDVQSLFTNAEY